MGQGGVWIRVGWAKGKGGMVGFVGLSVMFCFGFIYNIESVWFSSLP